MGRGKGTFLGVPCGWHRSLSVKGGVLRKVFRAIREEAKQQGCSQYPTREDVASNDTFFQEMIERYQSRTGQTIPNDKHPHFRRWIIAELFKRGGTPR